MQTIFLGMPPPNIEQWIKGHSQPLAPAYHADTWYKYASDTEWRTVSITGDISGNSSNHTPTTQIPSITNVVELEIGSDVTSIGDYAFYGCGAMQSVTIPDSVTSIGNYAFAWCRWLTSMTISNGVTSIGNNAFSGCDLLKNVTIPDSVTSIGKSALSECSSLTSATIGNGITRLENHTFASCQNLTSVTIGNGITYIGNTYGQGAFYRCIKLTSITIDKLISQVQTMNPSMWFGSPSAGTPSSVTIHCTDGSFTVTPSCFLKGTDIMLADGTTKKIEDLTYDDVLKVWDFDEGQLGSAKVCWLTKPGLTNDHYYQLTFDNGTVLKTTGVNSNHRIFSVDQGKFTNVCDAKVGDKVFSIDGTLTITDVKYIEEECEYYNVMTSGKINCFANGILTSDRYGNLYPIVDMKYVKDGRSIRPYSEYEAVGIDRYWYDNLRLGENTETMEKSKEYVWKCIGQMLPLPDTKN